MVAMNKYLVDETYKFSVVDGSRMDFCALEREIYVYLQSYKLYIAKCSKGIYTDMYESKQQVYR